MARATDMNFPFSELGFCSKCFGLFKKVFLYRHARTCVSESYLSRYLGKSEYSAADLVMSGSINLKAETVDRFKALLDGMRADEVRTVITEDPLFASIYLYASERAGSSEQRNILDKLLNYALQ